MDISNLTNSDKQVLQSAINQTVCKLKRFRAGLATEYHAKRLSESKATSGRRAISAKITQLHTIKQKMGIWEGYSQQPGSPYRDKPATPAVD